MLTLKPHVQFLLDAYNKVHDIFAIIISTREIIRGDALLIEIENSTLFLEIF